MSNHMLMFRPDGLHQSILVQLKVAVAVATGLRQTSIHPSSTPASSCSQGRGGLPKPIPADRLKSG